MNKVYLACLKYGEKPSRETFQLVIRVCLKQGWTPTGLADQFSVSKSTVERWASGISSPHQGVKAYVVDQLRDLTEGPER